MHILYQKFVKATGLRYSNMFKRSKVYPKEAVFAKCYGKCSHCKVTFFGQILSELFPTEDVLIFCTLSGEFNKSHYKIIKMTFSSEQRAKITEFLSISLYVTQIPEKTMKYWDL